MSPPQADPEAPAPGPETAPAPSSAPDPAGFPATPAPAETSRLIPSRFPPVAAFEDAASAEDLDAVFELEGWTNDRLSAPRLAQLAREEWVYGRPNASVVMAAFLHGSPSELRFSGQELGAWYASTDAITAVLEVANGLRAEIARSALPRITQVHRRYAARLAGDYADIRGRAPECHDPDPASYPAGQALGRRVRDEGPGSGLSGIRYDSVRRPGHDNWVCFRPRDVRDVTQAEHLEIDVPAAGKVVVRRLS
ncbi:MAG: RES domain-containing protein [Pseudomonadota bacterium]|nr:RES domain-containing protein [Pseudomonadota bacterium]MEE3100551.1 RES domain-containing protein [Pseudomonadota bacterium]